MDNKEKPDFIIVLNKGEITSIKTTQSPYFRYSVINMDKKESIKTRSKIFRSDDAFVDYPKLLNILKEEET